MCSTQADNNSRKLRLPVALVCPRPNRNEYQEIFCGRRIRLTISPPLWADCLENVGASTILWASTACYLYLLPCSVGPFSNCVIQTQYRRKNYSLIFEFKLLQFLSDLIYSALHMKNKICFWMVLCTRRVRTGSYTEFRELTELSSSDDSLSCYG
jgi:hypothetical protein